jgi:hypothetical protein
MGQGDTHRFRQFVRSCIVRPLQFLNVVGSSIETWFDWVAPETGSGTAMARPLHERHNVDDVRALNGFMLEHYPRAMFLCGYNSPRPRSWP